MLINKFKKDEYNIFISLKEINANKENKIYFYILPIEWISFVKEIKYKYNILFYDQYIDDRRIFIQSDNYYDNVNKKIITKDNELYFNDLFISKQCIVLKPKDFIKIQCGTNFDIIFFIANELNTNKYDTKLILNCI